MELVSLLKLYDYKLSPELVAQAPATPRDSARLLIFRKRDGNTRFDTFKNLGRHLPKNAVLVFNQTKVWPARLKVQKPSGGKAELLYISHDKNLIKVLSNKKLKANSLVALLLGRAIVQQMKIVKKIGAFYFLKPSFPMSRLPIILKKYGRTPLPPYIKHSPLSEKKLREQYQSVFAKTGLSVAAPTASLHFTKQLISHLQKQGTGTAFVQLDVNLGTFAPLREEQVKSGKLHQEFYNIDKTTAKFLNQAKKDGRPIIAVGTTVVRTLESASKNQRLIKLMGNTDLFIQENYKFKFVDGLITNFHVPKSSLLMLTSAFVGRKKLLNLYQQAINQNFRFFSFGDGMLILPLK
jgi:S-adenosylmethionine:tRNA ribosyltransferase-isomerase